MKMDKISLPIIRKACPVLVADKLVSLTISPNIGESFGIKIVSEPPKHSFGDLIHDFIYGYMVHDGDDFIGICEFVKIYGKASIKSLNEEK